MITKSDLELIDTKKMFKVYDEWPQIADESYNSDLEIIDFGKVNHIVFSGMGGSGSIGDFFEAILSKTNLHVNVVKGYVLPKNVNAQTLVVATSVSGNTAETLSVLDSAHKMGCKIIAFSSGGKMEEFSKKNNIKFIKIKKYHSPRASFVSFLYSILKILGPNIPVKNSEINNSIKELKKTCMSISSDNLTDTNYSVTLSELLADIPVIYYPWGLQAAAIRFKSSLQENAKTHALVEDVVEASHNGIVAWEVKSNAKPILLQGVDDYIKTKERWKILENYFQENNIQFEKVVSKEGDIITKLVNLIYLLDYTSIYLAIRKKVDPTPVKSIDYIKQNL